MDLFHVLYNNCFTFYLSLQVLENTIQLTLVKSLQMTLMALFEDCGFEEMAKPMLSLGLEFKPGTKKMKFYP